MRRILSASIWAPDALPLVQRRFKPVYRVFLPIVDGLFIIFGVFGLVIGSRVVQDFTLPWYNTFWSATIGAAALTALIGLAFEWNWVEIIAKLVLVISCVCYGLLLGLNVAAGTTNSALTITLTAIVVLIPIFRMLDLVIQIARGELRAEA